MLGRQSSSMNLTAVTYCLTPFNNSGERKEEKAQEIKPELKEGIPHHGPMGVPPGPQNVGVPPGHGAPPPAGTPPVGPPPPGQHMPSPQHHRQY